MLNLVLQISDSMQKALNAGASITTPPTPVASVSLFDMVVKGGIIMIPIALLFIIAIYVFIERLMTITKASKSDDNFMLAVKDHISNGNIQAARSFCKGYSNPVARVIEKGVSRIGKPIKDIERSMENVAKLEVYKMERFLNILAIVAGIAPMFGFLGTIAGMMKIFDEIKMTDNLSIGSIAGGINVKMITSAAGLIVGIFAFVCYNSLNALIDRVVNKIESASFEFIDLLQEPTA